MRGERVLVFGDFDADGLTGLAILVIALRRFGIDALPYVPSRLDEGHGLSLRRARRRRSRRRPVIVTVDCGSTSTAEIAEAGRRGLDVIVTDHHRVPAVLPAALAVVNPHRPDAIYPDRRLTGSGVAFKLAQLLLAEEPGGRAAALGLADLATIGTVADVAPIVGENRAIARLGLDADRARAAPRARGTAGACRDRAGRGGPRNGRIRDRAAAQRRRAGGGGRGGGPAAPRRGPGRGGRSHADALETANSTRRDLMKTAVAEARAVVAGAARCAGRVVRGPWSRRDRRARRGAGSRRTAAGRRSSGRSSGRDPGVVPERRLARPRRDAGERARTCSSATAATPARPASSCGRSLGRVPRALPRRSLQRRRRRTREPSCAIDLVLPALDVDYASASRSRAASRRSGRATPIRSSPSSG